MFSTEGDKGKRRRLVVVVGEALDKVPTLLCLKATAKVSVKEGGRKGVRGRREGVRRMRD